MSTAIDIRDFGAVPDDQSLSARAANTGAFRLIQSVMKNVVEGIDYSWGGRVFVPPGVFYLDDHIKIERAIELFGTGMQGESVLVFDPGKSLIVETQATSSDGKTASDCIVRDIQIWSAEDWNFTKDPTVDLTTFAGPSTGTPGVKLNAKAILQRLFIKGFSGTAVEIIADLYAEPPTNASNWQIQGGYFNQCGGHGVHTDGGDANGGLCVGLYMAGIGGNGIYESSQAGGTYIGCYVEEAKGRGFHNAQGPAAEQINIGNQATFVGCFAEGTQPSRLVGLGGVFLGGSSAFTDDSAAFVCLGFSPVAPFEIPNPTNPSIKLLAGYKDPTNAIFGYQTADEGGSVWLFRWLKDLNVWSTELGNSFPTSHRVSYQTAFGHPRGEGFQGFPSLILGEVSDPPTPNIKIAVGDAEPTAGKWERGDRVYNSSPEAGGNEGWVCVAGGTPGDWKKFGVIEA